MTTTEYTQIPFLLYFLTPRQVGFIPFWGCSAFLLLKLQTLTVRVFLMWLPNQFGSFSQKHAMVLWRRGFFGKGDLSRSEPSWLARQISNRRAGGKRV
jgi:hypothetical protein